MRPPSRPRDSAEREPVRETLADPAALATAAITALLALGLFMTVAALVGIVPSPPHDKLPFVATDVALAVAALVLLRTGHPAAPGVAALAALVHLPSVGPHKFLTEVHAAALTPVIVVGSLAILTTLGAAWSMRRAHRAG